MTDAETLIGLVSQYSPSGEEHGAAEWLVARMKSLGYEKAYIDDVGNAVGVLGQGPKQVVLLGHIDTVAGEIPVRVEDDVLFGRGSVDAKGPLACFTDAVARAGAKDGWQFVVIGAVEEERESDGARYVTGQYKPDFLIVGEPNSWDRVALGYKGSAWVQITLMRDQAHTAGGGETAAEAGVKAWLQIKDFVDGFNANRKRMFDRLLPGLHGMDTASNDFEQIVRLRVGVRLPMDVSPENWYSLLSESMKVSEGTQIRIEPIGYAIPAWECAKNSPLVRAFLSGIRSQGGEPRFVYKTGTADLNIVAPVWKCPALVYGPGDSSLDHTPNEHIQLEEYHHAVAALTAALIKLAG